MRTEPSMPGDTVISVISAMPGDAGIPTTSSTPESIPAPRSSFTSAVTLSRVQSVIGTLAAMASVTGAAYSLVQFAGGSNNTGQLVAIVQAADPRRSVSDAVVEVLTTENAIVATLTPDVAGQVTKELAEGVYVVRVHHPRYPPEVRRIQVLPRQSVEIRATLRPAVATPRPAPAKGSSTIGRAVGAPVRAVRKVFRF